MKIKTVKIKKNPAGPQPKRDRIDVAVLNKWSEPDAILSAWFQLSPDAKMRDEVCRTMQACRNGHDPYLECLRGFLDQCATEKVEVIVKGKNYPDRPFRIQANGPAYTAASKESPIKRKPDESEKEFFKAWDYHRRACFALLVYKRLDDIGLTPAQFADALDGDEDHIANFVLVDSLLPRDVAEEWVKGCGKVEIDSEKDQEQAAPIVQSSESLILAKLDGLTARIAALEKMSGSNVIQFPTETDRAVRVHVAEPDYFAMPIMDILAMTVGNAA